eukprot:4727179-Prymnesium_polylepis.1
MSRRHCECSGSAGLLRGGSQLSRRAVGLEISRAGSICLWSLALALAFSHAAARAVSAVKFCHQLIIARSGTRDTHADRFFNSWPMADDVARG